MKNSILTTFICVLLSASHGQSLFNEEFRSGSIPSNWTISQATENWSCEKSIKAFGQPNELRFASEPAFTGITKIISPEIDLTGYNEIVIRFNYYIDHVDAGYTFGIATSSNGGGCNIVWQKVPTQSIFSSDEFVIINNGDVGASDFQFCFFFEGNTEDINNIFIDDVELFHQYDVDVELSKLTMAKYCSAGEYSAKGRITNIGQEQISFVTLNYQVDGGDIYQTAINNIDLGFGDSYSFISGNNLLFEPGERVVDVWISEVNLLGTDDNQENDSLSKVINVANNSTQRLLLFEEFASSTCLPCANFNTNLFHPLLENNEGKYSLIKYPMNYPDPGDPYNIEYCDNRKDFYGISNIPHLQTEGRVSGLVSQNYINNAYSNPAVVDIFPQYSISGNQISVDIDIFPYVNITDANLYICVTEKITSGNVINNGETEFYNIMMEMLPSSDGLLFEGEAGSSINISESKDLSTSFIEEFDDLEIVVFIQDNETKQILQSSIANLITSVQTETANPDDILIYPNPFSTYLSIDYNITETTKIEINIIDIHSRTIKNITNMTVQQGHHSIRWDGKDNSLKEIQPGLYFIEIVKNGKAIYKKIIK